MREYTTAIQTSSPFRHYPNEKLTQEAAAVPRTVRLSQLDHLLLGIINRVLIVSGLLLYRYLEMAGLENVTLDDIRGCLRRLADNGYLNRMRFQTSTGQSNLQVYTLSDHGRKAVEGTGRSALRSGYVDRMDSLHAKRQLAALQFVIGQGYVPDSPYMAFGRLVRAVDDTTGNRLFRPQAVVQTEDKTVFVEAVRRAGGAAEDLIRKLNRIQDTLGGGQLNLTGPENYEVVVVAEDNSHMYQLMQELAGKLPGGFSFRLYFSNDQNTYFQNRKLYMLPEKQNVSFKLPTMLAELFGIRN